MVIQPRLHCIVHHTLTGYALAENSTVALNGNSEYISGCPGCGDYSSGERVFVAGCFFATGCYINIYHTAEN